MKVECPDCGKSVGTYPGGKIRPHTCRPVETPQTALDTTDTRTHIPAYTLTVRALPGQEDDVAWHQANMRLAEVRHGTGTAYEVARTPDGRYLNITYQIDL